MISDSLACGFREETGNSFKQSTLLKKYISTYPTDNQVQRVSISVMQCTSYPLQERYKASALKTYEKRRSVNIGLHSGSPASLPPCPDSHAICPFTVSILAMILSV